MTKSQLAEMAEYTAKPMIVFMGPTEHYRDFVNEVYSALIKAHDAALEEAATQIESSVNLTGIEKPSIDFINCKLQSVHDAKITRILKLGEAKK